MQASVNSVKVRTESVRTHVKPFISRGPSNFGNEIIRARLVPLAKVPRHYQFACAIQTDKCIRIADLFRVCFVREFVALFLLNERPNFIGLKLRNFHVPHPLSEQPFGGFTCQRQHVEDSSFFHIAEPCRSAHAVAFHEAV